MNQPENSDNGTNTSVATNEVCPICTSQTNSPPERVISDITKRIAAL